MLHTACDRCRAPIATPHVPPGTRAGHSADLGDSYVVLPADKRRSAALPDLSQTLRPGESLLQPTSMHEQLRTVSRLVELSETLHETAPVSCGAPLCEDCASGVLRELQRRLEEAHTERELLQKAFGELEAGEEEAGDDVLSEAEFEREREVQRREAAELRTALEAARQERDGLQAELLKLKGQQESQREQEEARHAQLNHLELERQEAEEEAMRSSQLVAHCESELTRLQKVSVYADVFRIDTSGPLGSINGLRLGRMAGVTVEWVELNAAMGQVVLLVHTLARIHGVTFTGHVLAPLGSFSKVYKLDEPKVGYELYGSGNAHLGRIFGGGKFDRGLVMLLACTSELLGHACSRPRAGVAAQPPYPIEHDSVGGACLKLQFKQEEWTRAFKHLLSDLMWLLQWHEAQR